MSNTTDQVQHIADIASRITPYSAGTAAGGGLIGWAVENSQIISLTLAAGGFLVTVAAFGVSWYYRHKTYKLQLLEHEQQQ